MDKRNCFFIILFLLLIVSFTFRIIRIRKLLKYEENVVAIKRFAWIGILFGIIGLVQLYFWIKHLVEFQGNFHYYSFNSTGLPSITLALACFDYNFITRDAVIILGTKYRWNRIENWQWKKDHYNVIILKTYVTHKFLKKSQSKLKTVELNVSQKQRDEVEKLLIQYIGESVE